MTESRDPPRQKWPEPAWVQHETAIAAEIVNDPEMQFFTKDLGVYPGSYMEQQMRPILAKYIARFMRRYAHLVATPPEDQKATETTPGRSRGGLARAAKLDPETRSSIARKAAQTRWNKP